MLFRLVSLVVFLIVSTSSFAAVKITIGEGNEIILPDEYSGSTWSVKWMLEDGTPLSESLIRANSASSFSILSNVGYLYGVLTEKASGNTLRTSAVNADRLRTTIARITLNGRGSASSIRFVNNGVTMLPDFSVEIAGITAEAPTGLATLKLPDLSGLVGEYEIKANFPERIGAVFLDDMGISAIQIHTSLKNLQELSLTGNYLDFNGFPENAPEKCIINFGNQNPVHISTLSDGISVDLSSKTDDSISVTWFDQNSKVISDDLYDINDLIYTFTGYTGKAWAELYSGKWDVTLKTTTVNINAEQKELFTASWAGAAGNAAFSITPDHRMLIAINDGDAVPIDAGQEYWIRLPDTSGTLTMFVSDTNAVSRIDMRDCGLYSLRFSDQADGLSSLLLGGNSFTPDAIPADIPYRCVIDWGIQPIIDITSLVNAAERWIDLTSFNDISVEWTDTNTNQPLTPGDFVERPSLLFTFPATQQLDLSARISSTIYPGLYWETNLVTIPAVYTALPEISRTQPFSIANHTITSQSSEYINVYTLDGRLVKKIAPRGQQSFPPGLYVVSAGQKSLLIKL